MLFQCLLNSVNSTLVSRDKLEKNQNQCLAAVGFEPTPPKRLVPKTSALDHSATLPAMTEQATVLHSIPDHLIKVIRLGQIQAIHIVSIFQWRLTGDWLLCNLGNVFILAIMNRKLSTIIFSKMRVCSTRNYSSFSPYVPAFCIFVKTFFKCFINLRDSGLDIGCWGWGNRLYFLSATNYYFHRNRQQTYFSQRN